MSERPNNHNRINVKADLEVLRANKDGLFVLDSEISASTSLNKPETDLQSNKLENFHLIETDSLLIQRKDLLDRFRFWQSKDKSASTNPLFVEVSKALANPDASPDEIDDMLKKLTNKLFPNS